MIYRKLDSNGDYTFGRGTQDFHSGTIAVAQAIKTKLLLLQAEWWEDINEGLPLFQNILGSSGSEGNRSGIDLLIQDRIAQAPGVRAIKQYESNYANRELSISCTVETIYDDATIEITF